MVIALDKKHGIMSSMLDRILRKPFSITNSYFLFGPRGTGKTTWLTQFYKNQAVYINLLKYDQYQKLLLHPNTLKDFITADKRIVIIDEIQKIPALLNEVHHLITTTEIKFILTGSSARSLRKKGVNLLAGRAFTYFLYPLTVIELKDNFNLQRALKLGQLPEVYFNKDSLEYLRSYIYSYLREEVIQEGLSRNLLAFNKFLEIASFSQGAVLNYTEIAREVGLNRKTVEGYFGILQDMLLAYYLPPFTKRAKRRLILKPKFYFFDVGIYRILRPSGFMDKPEEIEGIALESLVGQELRAINDYLQLGYNLYYFRTANGQEIDFVLYGKKGLLAIEVKRKKNISAKDLKNMKLFMQDYPEAKGLILYGGEHKLLIDNIEIWPLVFALKNLKEIL